MLIFDSSNPFPLVGPDVTYTQAQAHAAEVDAWLGLDTAAIEGAIAARIGSLADQELWIGLPRQRLLTPYTEFREMLERLQLRAGQTVVDLGAAYGRMGFVLARHFDGAHFLGYEFVRERVREGQRVGVVRLIEADLADPSFAPEPADIYFIYDYGSRRAIDKTLADLKHIAMSRPITVIGRGRRSRDAIEHGQPWLSQVVAPQHFAHYSIYKSHQATNE